MIDRQQTFHRSLIALALAVGLIAQMFWPAMVLADPPLADPALDNTTVGPPAPDAITPDASDFGPPAELAPLPPGTPKNPQQILAEKRKQDAIACQAESSAGGGLSALTQDSLQNGLAKDIGTALPSILDDALRNDLPGRLQTALHKELGSIVSDGLKRELPLRLAPRIQGLTQTQLENQFPTLLRNILLGTGGEESSLLQDVLRNGVQTRLPRLVGESVRGSLGAHLGPGLDRSTEIFIRGQFGGQIGSMVSDVFEIIIPYFGQLLQSIQGSIEGIKSSITSMQASFSNPLAILSLPGQISQLQMQIKELQQQFSSVSQFIDWLKERKNNQQQLTDDIIQNLTVVIQENLTKGDTIERLTDALAADITNPIIDSLEGGMDSITTSFIGPVNNAIASIENLPSTFLNPIRSAVGGLIDTTTGVIDAQIRTVVNAITSPIDAITVSLSQTIEQTMTSALQPLTNTLTDATIGASGFIAGPINVATESINTHFFGYNMADMVDPAGNALYPNSYYENLAQPPYVLAPDSLTNELVGPPAPADLPLAGSIKGLASEGAGAASSALGPITERTVANQFPTGGLGGIGSTLAQGLTGSLASGLGGLVSGVPYVGGVLQNVVTQAVNQAFAAAGLSGAVGLAVPTTEIGGLLQTSQNTSKLTGQIKGINEQMKKTQEQLLKTTAEIKSLQIESCTYLKALRRIQYAMEDKEFVQDPDAKKANGRAIEFHNIKLFDNIFKFARAPGNAENLDPETDKEPLVPKNLNAAVIQAQREAGGGFLDELKQIDSPFLNDSLTKLKVEQEKTFADKIKPTISPEDYDKITSGAPDSFNWDTWLQLIQPQNNPAGAEYLAREELARRQAAAEENTREEYAAGLGFLNADECVKYSESGWCIERKTKTPGSVAQGYAVAALTSPIRQGEGTEILNDYLTPEFDANLERLKDISNYAAAGSQSVYHQADPCPGPGPCPDSGWGKIPTPKPETPAAPTAPTPPAPRVIPQVTGLLSLDFNFDTPTLAEVNAGQADITTFQWRATAGASECRADNDWPGTTVSAGALLPTTGERQIEHPVGLGIASITRADSATGVTSELPLTESPATDRLKTRIIFNPQPAAGGAIHRDDVYTINFAASGETAQFFDVLPLTVGAEEKIDPPAATTVIRLFQKKIGQLKNEETPLATELAKYLFVGTTNLTITPELTYRLACYKGNDRTVQTVKIRR
ncbi:MAG: hypothetical protein AAB677_00250 [Patescibacteria group bacterium]